MVMIKIMICMVAFDLIFLGFYCPARNKLRENDEKLHREIDRELKLRKYRSDN